MKNIIKKLKSETVFIIATIFAVVTSFIVMPKTSYIDIHVLMILFNLMVVVELYRKEDILDAIAIKFLKKYKTQREISRVLILLVFFFSMFLTNDVGLITFVPLTIIIGKKANFSVLKIVILETIAANIGSSFTPMGNPQNLYIFSKYGISPLEFFKVTWTMSILGLMFLMLINLKTPKNQLKFDLKEITINKNIDVLFASGIFIFILFSIFLNIPVSLLTIATFSYLVIRRDKTIFKLDWILLATFVSFFIFVGNISNIPIIKDRMLSILSEKKSIYLSSIFFSQIISNVPTAILVSEFTTKWKPLLVGANLGGMGTLIASLASLISYKLYINEYLEDKKRYIKLFTILNVILLFTMGFICYFFID